MASRGLTSAEDHTHIHTGMIGNFGRLELDEGHSISVREQGFDVFLVVNTLGGSTLLYFYRTLQGFRQFGLIGSTR